MKKSVLALVICSLCAVVLFGCGTQALPNNLTNEQVAQAAAQCITQINQEDYAAVVATMTEDMKSTLTEERLQEAFAPVKAVVGAPKDDPEPPKIKVQTAQGVQYVTLQQTVHYEQGDLTFQLTYDENLQLAGLFFK